jgi:hypothetical protein
MVSRLLGRTRMSLRHPHTDAILILGSLALGGCAYQADSFSYAREPFSGVYMTVDCLDLAIDRQSRQAASKNVITYAFGNRCNDPVVVDLASVRVFGRADDGTEMQLFAFDPANEIRALRIDGRAVGREAIEYPSKGTLKSLCVDAGSIARSSVPRWVCFDDRD